MKRLKIIILAAMLTALGVNTNAQNLQYHTIATDSSGVVHISQTISLRISIMQDNKNNQVIYCEKFTITSDTMGVVSFTFGNGTLVSGDINSINWGGTNVAKLEVDPNAGNNFAEIGYSEVNTTTYLLVTNL